MIGKGVLGERFQPRTCSGKKTLKTDQVKGNIKNVVLIELDSDQVDDVVIIDFPEFMQQSLHGSTVPSKDRKYPLQSVISIDDDESYDEDHPGIIAEGGGESDSHVCENDCVSNLPKSRQTSCAKAADRNRYGLDGSESDLSDSDCSDCELMEVCEQWEKASVKRKRNVFNDQAGYDEQASSSGFHSHIYTDIEVENRTEQHAGSPVYCGSSAGKCVKENLSSFSVMGERQMDEIYCNLWTENPSKDSYQKVNHDSFKFFSSGSVEEGQSLHRSSDFQRGERSRSEEFSPYTKYRSYKFSSGITGSSRFRKELGHKKSNFTSSSSRQEEIERQVDNDGSAFRNKDDNFFAAFSNFVSFAERHNNHDGLVSQQSCDRQPNSGISAKEKFEAVPEDSLFCNPESLGKSRVCNKQYRSCLVENENASDVGNNALHAQDGGVSPSNEIDIINEREKLKETDEYKRAIEDEWASRQQQLQIQAEEAQRLRKRKKAESKRLLDMQRRQKERIEEVRETQKKDEEFINMKEQLRVDIRNELNKLEMTCIDMTSLLRGLGIQVGGGFNPLPNEVRAAYKRALFKFHPDRALKTDIREQVEAEEKFKLISRMKEKFLSNSMLLNANI